MVKSLTYIHINMYVELLKKDGMEEEASIFALYSSLLQEATGTCMYCTCIKHMYVG